MPKSCFSSKLMLLTDDPAGCLLLSADAEDVLSGYSWGKMFGTLDERKWLSRIIYLETVAGVPGE